jgi:hypothetical protein
MGCQHSSAVPTAQDFYYRPSTRVLGMNDKVAPIVTPGMCYGLSLNYKTSELTDNQGQKIANGLQLMGPFDNGSLLLTDLAFRPNTVAVMNRKRHSSYKLYYEILCPRPPCTSGRIHAPDERWCLWATVHQAPHTLEFEMVLANTNGDDNDSTTLYTLQYCGPIWGTIQMRVDKGLQPLALIQLTGEKWGLVIGPGVDPCLVVCFMAIVKSSSTRR